MTQKRKLADLGLIFKQGITEARVCYKPDVFVQLFLFIKKQNTKRNPINTRNKSHITFFFRKKLIFN